MIVPLQYSKSGIVEDKNTIQYEALPNELNKYLQDIRNNLFYTQPEEETIIIDGTQFLQPQGEVIDERPIEEQPTEYPGTPQQLEQPQVQPQTQPQVQPQNQQVKPQKVSTNNITASKVKGNYQIGSQSKGGGRKAYIYYNNKSQYTKDFVYGNKQLLQWDITDLLKSRGFDKINNKTIHYGDPSRRIKGKKNSWHRFIDQVTGKAMARDISIYKGNHSDYDAFRKKLMADPIVMTWMNLKGWGIINEITPEIRAITKGTGDHFHFGPDQWAQRTWHLWQLNPSIPVTKKLQEGGIIKNRFTN